MNKLIALFLSLLTALPAYGAGPVLWGPAGALNISSGPVYDRNTPYIKQRQTNYISNGNGSINTAGWTTNGAVTVTRVTTALPRAVTEGTGLSLAAGSATHYAEFCFTIDASDKNTKVQWTFSQAPASYTSGDFRIEAYSYATAACGSSPVELSLSTDIPATGHTPLENFTGSFLPTSFDTTSADFYGIRFVRVAGASTLVISNVIVGPGNILAVPAIGPWIAYTPTGSWTAFTTYAGWYRRVGDTMEVRATAVLAGTPTTAIFTLSLPSGFTMDSTKISFLSTRALGDGSIYDDSGGSGFSRILAQPIFASSTTIEMMAVAATASGSTHYTVRIDQATPIPFANNDVISVNFAVPIAEWAGAPNFAGQNDVEYGFNTQSTINTNDTTSFGYGPQGTVFLANTTATNYDIRWQTPIQATDTIFVQLSLDSGATWFALTSINFMRQGAASYGVGVVSKNSNTSTFTTESTARSTNATYAGAGEPWTSWIVGSTIRWRVVKSRAGVAQAFGLATATQSGLIPRYQQGTYTPVFTDGTNGFGNPSATLNFTRIGNRVTVEGQIRDVNATASATASQFDISLPIATTSLTDATASGVCNVTNGSVSVFSGGLILAGSGNNTELRGYFLAPATSTNNYVSLRFSYTIN